MNLRGELGGPSGGVEACSERVDERSEVVGRGVHAVDLADRRARLLDRSPRVRRADQPISGGSVSSPQAQYSSFCGRSSVISYHGAFEPTKMCSLGRIAGTSTSDPIATCA